MSVTVVLTLITQESVGVIAGSTVLAVTFNCAIRVELTTGPVLSAQVTSILDSTHMMLLLLSIKGKWLQMGDNLKENQHEKGFH